jgi:hypothetical protein
MENPEKNPSKDEEIDKEEEAEDTGKRKKEWKDVYMKFVKGAEPEIAVEENISNEEINTEVSWKEVPWDSVREEIAKQVIEAQTEQVGDEKRGLFPLCSEYSVEQLEKEAANYWDKFYTFNQGKFFKDRHYLHFQFKDLSTKEGASHHRTSKIEQEKVNWQGRELLKLDVEQETLYFH